MRANSSDSQDTVTAEQPIKPERLRLLDRLSKYRQPIGLAVTLLLFAIALIACRHLLAELDLDALHDSILDVPKPALLGAFGATVVGFIILLGYEWSASRYASVQLPKPALAMGGFCAFAIGNAGASNAALFAAAMLAPEQPAIGQALEGFRSRQTEDVMAHDDPRQ